jgi:hypothetical protein
MRTTDAAAKVNADHDCEAPSPGLGFKTTSALLGRSDRKIDAKSNKQVDECLYIISGINDAIDG